MEYMPTGGDISPLALAMLGQMGQRPGQAGGNASLYGALPGVALGGQSAQPMQAPNPLQGFGASGVPQNSPQMPPWAQSFMGGTGPNAQQTLSDPFYSHPDPNRMYDMMRQIQNQNGMTSGGP